MKLQRKIQKQGNSAGVLVPASMLKAMNIGVGSNITLDMTRDGLLVAPAKTRYSLKELAAQCNPKGKMPTDLALFDTVQPVGNELI